LNVIQRPIDYLEFRKNGLLISSGRVESDIKQYKQRLCGTELHWNADNAERMLVLRSASLSNQFDYL
jgi:hypothetical protein